MTHNSIHVPVVLCSNFFVVSQFTATATPSVTVEHSGALATAFYVGLAAASGHHEVVLPTPLILRDTMRGVVGLTSVPEKQQPQSLMPS